MTTYAPDGLFAFGNALTVEVPAGAAPDTANDAAAKAPLGTLFRYKGNLYRYVKFDNGSSNVAALIYGAVHWKSLDPSVGLFTVTSEYANALGTVNTVAGILGVAVTDLYYTWIQVAGVATAKVAASVVAGDFVIGGSTDLVLNRIASGQSLTSLAYGIAVASRDGSGNCLILLEAKRLANL